MGAVGEEEEAELSEQGWGQGHWKGLECVGGKEVQLELGGMGVRWAWSPVDGALGWAWSPAGEALGHILAGQAELVCGLGEGCKQGSTRGQNCLWI